MLTSRTGAEVADTLKYVAERIPATFIYVGIDIEHSTLLSDTPRAADRGPLHPHPRGPVPLTGRLVVSGLEVFLRYYGPGRER
ncbi:hypothetical protein [Streptomyces cellulosae]|uniref:hypothetical protein n=1 Tax=Streptomyces cellulosae TaxID=1968 RepID=UPI0004C60E97